MIREGRCTYVPDTEVVFPGLLPKGADLNELIGKCRSRQEEGTVNSRASRSRTLGGDVEQRVLVL